LKLMSGRRGRRKKKEEIIYSQTIGLTYIIIPMKGRRIT